MNPAAFLVGSRSRCRLACRAVDSKAGPSVEPANADDCGFLFCLLFINHHAAGLVICQCSWMIKGARVHPNAGD
jgi:hypothetical protein